MFKFSKSAKIAIICSVIVVVSAMQIATQYVAYQFFYNVHLGYRLFSVAGYPIYFFGAVMVWVGRYQSLAPHVFQTAGLIFLPTFVVVAFLIVGFTRRVKPTVKEFGADDWGNAKDARAAGILHQKGALPHGVVLGRWGDVRDRDILFYEGPEHQLVVGASRSGKGAGHVIPTLLSWGESMFVYDPKEECYDVSAHFRSKFSHCFFLNFGREDSARFNPLMEVPQGLAEVSGAQRIAAGLVDSSSDNPGGGWDFFDKSSFILLTAIILHVLYVEEDESKTLESVRNCLFYLDRTLLEMENSHHRYKRKRNGRGEQETDEDGEPIAETHPEIHRVATLFLRMSSKQRDAIQGTAITMLAIFGDPMICETTSRSDFRVGDLMCADAPVSMFLQVAPDDQLRLRPLTRLVITQLGSALLKKQFHDSRGRKKKHKLLTLIDEFPSLGRLDMYVANLKQMAGYGIKAHLTVQSFKDIASAYGRDATILDNMHITVAFAGADPDSNEHISKMTVESREMREGASSSGIINGRVTTSFSESERRLLTPGQVRELPYDTQLVFVTGSPTFRTPKLRYFEDPLFKSRATDIRAGLFGPDQSLKLDVPFPGGEKGHGDWIGVRAVYRHVPTQEELDKMKEDSRRGGGTGRVEDPAEAAPTEAQKAELAEANARQEAAIDKIQAELAQEDQQGDEHDPDFEPGF